MIRPLIISRSHFLPDSTGGQIERHFINNLPKDMFTPTIISTTKGDKGLIADCRNEYYLVPERISLRIPAGILRRIGCDGLTYIPDVDYYTWGIAAKKFIRKNIDTDKFDYMHCISYPCANQMVALDVKRRTGLPWIAHLYDPWHDNPYRIHHTPFTNNKDLEQERLIAENADLILHVNHIVYNLWLERYGDLVKNKMHVLPLILNTAKEPKLKEIKGEKLIISHIGNFVINRTSIPFIESVNMLMQTNPEFRNLLQINYIGNVTPKEKDLISQYGLEDIFNMTGIISEDECIKYYEQTDLFLSIDGTNTKNIFFPSKIMKYFYYRKPILGITPADSVLTNELNQSRHTAIDNNDIDSITRYLHRAITDYKSLLGFDMDYWKRHSLDNIYKQYINLVNSIINI